MSNNISEKINKIRNKISSMEEELERLEQLEEELKIQRRDEAKYTWKFAHIIYLIDDIMKLQNELENVCEDFMKEIDKNEMYRCDACPAYDIEDCPYAIACSIKNNEMIERDWAIEVGKYIKEYKGE